MSLRIRPPINAPDEWFDEVERVFDKKQAEATTKSDAPASPVPAPPARTSVTYVEPNRGKPKPTPTAATAPQTKPQLQSGSLQDYGERLVKLIPSEVVGLYLVGVGVIPATAKVAVTVWAVLCLGLVVLARAYATRDQALNLPPQWKAVVISSVSFVIWVYTIPGPFQALGVAVPYIGSLAILVWTFVVPYFYTGA